MKIGKLNFDNPLCLAPMEDVTDNAFRIICRQMGADMVYTEFASAEALMRAASKTRDKIMVTEGERPVVIQIFGGSEVSIREAVKISEAMNPDWIDINCGCWVKKVVMRGEGAGLLRDLKKMEKIIRTAVESTILPVTVKTRLGWDEKNLVILEVARMVEGCGAKALALHCRTREQGYKGLADWSWLEKVKKIIQIPLIGNGDVKTPMDVKRMFETGCDGVMIGRAAVGNPWLFKQAKAFLKDGTILEEPDLEERIRICLEHVRLAVDFKGERGVKICRKFFANYFKGMPHVSELRQALVTTQTINDLLLAFEEYRTRWLTPVI